jgi:predicted MFS family arabinose efflux permease
LVAITLALILAVIPATERATKTRHVDLRGALLCASGLAGPVFALIEQPRLGWSSPGVLVPLIAGVLLIALFLRYEARASDPMLPLGLFRQHNFSVGNIETFAMYAGLAVLFFFLVLFLQQIGGYSPLSSGLATLPSTLVMFVLSRRFGGLADRFGPRLFMGLGPLLAAAGLALFLRVGAHVDYAADVLPALLVFSLGLSMTVAPLTAAVLAGVDEHQAGIASGVNNAIARIAGLLATAAIGAVVAAQFTSTLDARVAKQGLGPQAHAVVVAAKKLPLGRPDVGALPRGQARLVARAADDASVKAFHLGVGIAAALVALGGLTAAVGIRNPTRVVRAETCQGGQLVAAPLDAADGSAARRAAPARAARSLAGQS